MKDQAAHRRFILSLGAIIALGPLSIDMYLPSLPAIGRALAADAASVQMSVSAYFAGLAIGQLVYGPITDRFGRKKPLLFGLVLFSIASFGCALAGNIDQLIAFRGLQALGGCAGIVVSRALVRDHYAGNEMARVLSSLMLVMGVAPVLAPMLGGKLQLWFGWNSIFLLLAVFGVACLLITAFRIAEPQRERAPPLSVAGIAQDYVRILKHRRFMGYSLAGACGQAGMFSYITASPFVFIDYYGLAPDRYGMLFGANACGLILCTQLNALLLRRLRAEKVMRGALRVHLFGAAVMAVSAFTGLGGIWGVVIPLIVVSSCIGFTFPNAQAAAMEPFGGRAGTAAAMLGTQQFVLAGFSSLVVGQLHTPGASGMAIAIFCWSLLAQVALRVLVKPPQQAV
ncbi:Bcr/CflA family multidrug efflux MFS transporter [Hydrocarboniphaga effusa]|jgi:DHA1 family bicyclomycin/chloramphenicol resistance-like MFS transporter|uniref:Bcr/CflA family efflux transporter n=1 Tax=Hydrocarboniphaga effusa AP103 TaxID=1172194 RepID=I8T3J0_9GAMM|nr:Bcr/CflA family multidrug efflux MFS transporter [Hydrocarboniphaga effusa]EIT68283.1 hypothetical protein WQQ_34780 [Hydrocarboniphaga effusa AP103]